MRFSSLLVFSALLLSGTAFAQRHTYESLTSWTHKGGSPNWIDDVADTNAKFGKVDQLVSIDELVYTRNALQLPAGTYVATVRVMKRTDQADAAPLTLQVTAGATRASVDIPVAEQTVDSYIWSRALTFTVRTPVVALFSLSNTDKTKLKKLYSFDAFHLSRVDIGKADRIESVTRRWGRTWGSPHASKEVEDKDSYFGFVEKINNGGGANLWWLAYWSKPIQLTPGFWTGNLRIKKVVSATGIQVLDWFVRESLDGGKSWKQLELHQMPPVDQTIDQYRLTPHLTLRVTNPRALYQFRLHNTRASRKANYHFDALILRRGEYSSFGTSCNTSAGATQLRGSVPMTGEVHDIEVRGVPTAALLILGASRLNVDLTAAGATACSLYATPTLLLPAAATGGVAKFQIPIPGDPKLVGVRFYNQGIVLDPKANALGLATTNGRQGSILQ